MRTTVGRIRHAVCEAIGGKKLSDYEGVQVGSWYKERPVSGFGSADVAQLIDLSEREGMVIATRRFPSGHSVTSRFDVWMEKFDGPASAADVKKARAQGEDEIERTARAIDTSREGT